MTSFKNFDCAKIMNYPERNVENIIFHQKKYKIHLHYMQV